MLGGTVFGSETSCNLIWTTAVLVRRFIKEIRSTSQQMHMLTGECPKHTWVTRVSCGLLGSILFVTCHYSFHIVHAPACMPNLFYTFVASSDIVSIWFLRMLWWQTWGHQRLPQHYCCRQWRRRLLHHHHLHHLHRCSHPCLTNACLWASQSHRQQHRQQLHSHRQEHRKHRT